MKLPTIEELKAKLLELPSFRADTFTPGGGVYRYEVEPSALDTFAQSILEYIKYYAVVNTEDNEADPRSLEIAQLEAKIFVYETFIKSAGFKLPTSTKKKEEK